MIPVKLAFEEPPKEIIQLYYELGKQLDNIMGEYQQEALSDVFTEASPTDKIMADFITEILVKYNFKSK